MLILRFLRGETFCVETCVVVAPPGIMAASGLYIFSTKLFPSLFTKKTPNNLSFLFFKNCFDCEVTRVKIQKEHPADKRERNQTQRKPNMPSEFQKNFTIYEDPDCRENTEEPAAPATYPSNDLSQRNPNAQPGIDAGTNPGPHANMLPPAAQGVPETPGTFAAIGIRQMMLGSVRHPVALATDRFIAGDNNNNEDNAPPSPSPVEGFANLRTRQREQGGGLGGITARVISPTYYGTEGNIVMRPELDQNPSPRPRMNVGERLMHNRFQGPGDVTDVNWDLGLASEFPIRIHTPATVVDNESLPPPRSFNTSPLPPCRTGMKLFASDAEAVLAAENPSLESSSPGPFTRPRSSPSWRTRRVSVVADHASLDTKESPSDNERTVGGPSGNRPQTPIRDTSEVPSALPQTVASRMPPPQTPASRMQQTQSPATRLLASREWIRAYTVRDSGAHGDNQVRENPLARQLFGDPSSPAPSPSVWEPQPIQAPTLNTPHQPSSSRLRFVSHPFDRNNDTEMASPREITPKSQTGGSPPMPPTPRTPRAWISATLLTPELASRMIVPRPYRGPDEPMMMTPSPPGSDASPKDKVMEDFFWTPNKAKGSSNVAPPVKNNAPIPKPILTENTASVCGDAVTQGPAANEDSALVEDAAGPSTTTVKTVINTSTEITTTIMTTPSPPNTPTPTPARRISANLRLGAATPRKAGHIPGREAASAPKSKGKCGTQQKTTTRRRTADQIFAGGINRRHELRTSPRYSLRETTKGVVVGKYSFTPTRNKTFEAKAHPATK